VLKALPLPLAILVLATLASTLLAQRSLWSHVSAVGHGFAADGLAGGRKAVSMIVGRNPQALDSAGVIRAAIESLAENFSDGIVAPALWCAIAGLPGIAVYKAINTADSMIGHKTPRHAAFGFAAAKLDDLVNFLPARLSALLITVAAFLVPGASPRAAWRSVRRDAGGHPSPNAGWPEAAFAGALGVRLGGPRAYAGVTVEDAWIGLGKAPSRQDIRRALRLYRCACGVHFAGLTLIALVIAQA